MVLKNLKKIVRKTKISKKTPVDKRVRILDKKVFKKNCTVMYVAKALDEEGNPGNRLYTHFDPKIVIGFRSENDVYRGIIDGYRLGLSSIQYPQPGKEYSFISCHEPINRKSYKLVQLSEIKPIKSFITRFF